MFRGDRVVKSHINYKEIGLKVGLENCARIKA